MDEQIWVESTKGEGSAFTFTVHRNPPVEKEQ
jgi:signal transduction histidine kinase